MRKTYTLRYYETFGECHADEYNEEEYQTEQEVREALCNLCHSFNVRDVEVSENTVFEDFHVEAWELGLDK